VFRLILQLVTNDKHFNKVFRLKTTIDSNSIKFVLIKNSVSYSANTRHFMPLSEETRLERWRQNGVLSLRSRHVTVARHVSFS